MPTFLLASRSAARKEMLEKAKVPFLVEVSSYEEDMTLDMPPNDLAMYLSRGKASDVAAKFSNAVILGVDSFAVCDGELLGKPHTIQRAREMLSMLSGREHTYMSGFTIIDSKTGQEYSEAVESQVYFRTLSEDEINSYLAKESVMDLAAAYSSQGLGAAFIEKIEGDPSNVRGLPLSRLTVALREFGINLV